MSLWTRLKFVLAGIRDVNFGQPFLILSFYNSWLKDWVQDNMYLSILQGGTIILTPVKLTYLIADFMKKGKCLWLIVPDLPEGKEYEFRFLKEGEKNCITLYLQT